jgi:hypothetical protein
MTILISVPALTALKAASDSLRGKVVVMSGIKPTQPLSRRSMPSSKHRAVYRSVP